MHKLIFIISMIFISNLMLSQKVILKTDSVYFEKKIKELKELSKSNLEKARITNDSLERELFFYRVKEDHFAAALEDQASRFAVIVTGILALTGLIAFGGFKMEVYRISRKLSTQFLEQKGEFESYKVKLKKLEANIFRTSGNLFTKISQDYEAKGELFSTFQVSLWAAKDQGRCFLTIVDIKKLTKNEDKDINKEEVELKFVIDLLKVASNALNEMVKKNIHKKELIENYEDFILKINEMNGFKNKTITNLASEIRIKLNEFTEKDLTLS